MPLLLALYARAKLPTAQPLRKAPCAQCSTERRLPSATSRSVGLIATKRVAFASM